MAIEFRARDFFHPLAIWRLHRDMERRQWQPLPVLQKYQDDRLQRTIRLAYAQVPYYQRLFRDLRLSPEDIRSAADLKKLPLLSRDAVRSAGGDLLAARSRGQHPRPHHTSGSSGVPMTVWHGRDSNALEFAYYWRYWGWAGFRPGMHFAELQTSFFLRRKDSGDGLAEWQPHLGRLLLNSNRVGPMQAAAMAREIRRRHCRFLKGLATTLAGFALACREAGVDDLDFLALFSTGETLSSRSRTLLEAVFRSPVLDSYGHMERTVAISQCPQGGYHLNADYGVLELEDLQPVDGGQSFVGRAVGTSLHNPSMPLIRYDIGDRIELFADPPACPCGRTLPLVKSIHGRFGETLVTPDGRYLTSLPFLAELMTGVRFAQFVQEAPARLALQIVPEGRLQPQQREWALQLARRAVGPGIAVTLREVGIGDLVRDSSGKMPIVVPLAGFQRSLDHVALA
jgi:phenylacetate-CoA ligase